VAELVEPPVCAAGDSPVVARGGGWCRRRVGYRFTRNLSFGEHHVRRGFLIFVAGAAIGAVADLGAQALGNMANGCDAFDNINWGQVAGSALIGGLSGGRSAFAASRAAKAASGAESAVNGARLSQDLSQLEKYGQAGSRQLESGRIRYTGNLSPANKPGEMVGRRLVREWDPASGATRTWHETLDGAGNVRIVRPETGGDKVHYFFDVSGNFGGTW